MRRVGRSLIAVVGLVGLTVISACGDDGGSGDGPAEPVRGITDTSITVGGIGNRNFVGAEEGAKARIARANESGGVDGRTIEFLGVRDDENDGDRNLSLVRELVDRDRAFAVVPLPSGALQPAAGAYMDEQGVPFVGIGSRPSFCEATQHGFGHNGCLLDTASYNTATIDPLAEVFGGELEGVEFAIATLADDVGQRSLDQARAVIEERGGSVVYGEANVPRGGGIDYQPFVDAILDSSPDAVLLVQDYPNSLGLKRLLVASGFGGPIADYLTYVPGLLESSPDVVVALEGTYIVNSLTPSLEEDTPYVEQMIADFDAVGITSASLGTILGYVQMDLFLAMVDEVDGDFASFAEIINGGFRFEPADGGVPISFPENRTRAVPCASLITVIDGEYEQVSAFSCYENLPVG